MTELLMEFGVPLKIILWGYIVVQGIALLVFLLIGLPMMWRIFHDLRKEL